MRVNIIHHLQAQNFRLGNVGCVLLYMFEIAYQINENEMENIAKRALRMRLLVGYKLGNSVFNQSGNFTILEYSFIAAAVILRDIFQVFGIGCDCAACRCDRVVCG